MKQIFRVTVKSSTGKTKVLFLTNPKSLALSPIFTDAHEFNHPENEISEVAKEFAKKDLPENLSNLDYVSVEKVLMHPVHGELESIRIMGWQHKGGKVIPMKPVPPDQPSKNRKAA